MKHFMCVIFCIFLLPCCFGIHAAAEDTPYSELPPVEIPLPEAVQAEMDSAGIIPDAPETVLNYGPSQMLSSFWNSVKSEAAAPFFTLGGLLALTAVSALLSGTGNCAPEMQRTFSKISVLLIAASTAIPLVTSLARTAEALDDGRVLMAGFVPVFSGFLAAGGSVSGAAAYQLIILFLTEFIIQLTTALLFPMLRAATALGIADAISPSVCLGSIADGLRSAVSWILGTVMALFAALLSVRSFVASAADSVGSKTVKLLSSALIPIVGSAVSDTYSSVSGSIRLIGTGVGAAGILAVVFLILPPVISVILYRLIFRICRITAEIVDSEMLKKLFANSEQILSGAFAMLVSYALMLIFSTAVMLMLCRG
ncbi:MAG: stage III sporulation protein AE [Oscillospiraceae bacterium]|nr:stage III sporulation protein AE [Oscillospiraceae bacterium]